MWEEAGRMAHQRSGSNICGRNGCKHLQDFRRMGEKDKAGGGVQRGNGELIGGNPKS